MKAIKEAIFLLNTYQPPYCSEWKMGVGDCKKIECDFCRIEKCIEKLEKIKP